METWIQRIKCGFVNCYLLGEGNGRVLVDTGSGNLNAVLRGLARYGVSPGALNLVLLTHGHPDHTGAAGYFQARGIPVALHPADACAPGALRRRDVVGTLLLAVSKSAVAAAKPILPEVWLEDGASLAPYGISATVLALPGHTPGSVGVLLEDGSLVCGDTFMNFLAPSPAHIAEDFAELECAITSLKEHGVTKIYPGHGKPFRYQVK